MSAPEKTCACGAVWDARRFAEVDCVTDCPSCKPDEWSLAISLTGCKPLRIGSITVDDVPAEDGDAGECPHCGPSCLPSCPTYGGAS